jgi:hypothetical protein
MNADGSKAKDSKIRRTDMTEEQQFAMGLLKSSSMPKTYSIHMIELVK